MCAHYRKRATCMGHQGYMVTGAMHKQKKLDYPLPMGHRLTTNELHAVLASLPSLDSALQQPLKQSEVYAGVCMPTLPFGSAAS